MASATEANRAATTSDRAEPIRVSIGPAIRGTPSATSALGTMARPTCQASQPWLSSTAGIAISIANHEAGTAAAATALRTTRELRITETGRKPCGRRRTCRATAGAPNTIRPMPTSATTRPVDGDCTSSTMPAAVPATSSAPRMSRLAPLPSSVSARHRNGMTSTPSTGSAITARQPNAPSTRPPTSGPRQLTAAAVPASRPNASPRTAPS